MPASTRSECRCVRAANHFYFTVSKNQRGRVTRALMTADTLARVSPEALGRGNRGGGGASDLQGPADCAVLEVGAQGLHHGGRQELVRQASPRRQHLQRCRRHPRRPGVHPEAANGHIKPGPTKS